MCIEKNTENITEGFLVTLTEIKHHEHAIKRWSEVSIHSKQLGKAIIALNMTRPSSWCVIVSINHYNCSESGRVISFSRHNLIIPTILFGYNYLLLITKQEIRKDQERTQSYHQKNMWTPIDMSDLQKKTTKSEPTSKNEDTVNSSHVFLKMSCSK